MKKLVRAVPRRSLRSLKSPTILLLALALTLVLVAVAGNAVPRPVRAATETLNPNAAGTQTNLNVVPSGTNWEACSTAGGSYVSWGTNVWTTDLYALPNPVLAGTINSVTVGMIARASTTGQASARTVIWTGAGTYLGDQVTLTTSWESYSTVYATNPSTLGAWTWANVNDLEAGVSLRRPVNGATSDCDQVWVVVDYTPPAVPTTLTVAAASGTYGGTVDLTATLSPAVAGKTIDFYINGESKGSAATLASGVATLSGVALTVGGVPLTVGTYTGAYNTSGVGASFAGDVTYEPSTSAADLTVNQKELTVSGITADDKTYDGSTDATIDTSSAALEGVIGGDNVTLNTSAAAGAFASKNVDTGITVTISGLTLNGADAGNYFLTPPTTSASITARDLTATANGINKIYDGTTAATVTLGTDALGSDNVTPLFSSASFADENVGNGKAVSVSGISITGSDAGNYQLLNTTTSTTADITPKALSITADSTSKTYGDMVIFAGTEFTASGLVAGDNITFVILDSTGASAAATVAGSPYDIVPSDATGTGLGNYTISYINGTLTVDPKALTITANDRSKTIGDTVTFAGTEFTASGLVNSDTVTSVTLTSAGAAPAAPVGSYDIVPSDAVGTGLGNYTISYVNGTLTVNPAVPTIISVSPNQEVQGMTCNVTISGSSLTGATSVSFGADIIVNSFTVDGATQVTANITISGSATPGLRDVSVVTPGGTATLTNGFTVLAMPTISSVNPSAAVQDEALSVTIAGTNLTGVTAVDFGSGITVNSFTVDSDTQITASITVGYSATVGVRDVSVTKAGGTATLSSGFTVNQATPAISTVSPDQGTQGQTADVTITGTHFTGTTSVDFGSGITVNSFSVTPSSGSSQVQIGTGTAGVSLPFYTNHADARIQCILLASEIGQPGLIQKLRLYCSTRPGQDLSHFYIRMQHTALTSFPSGSYVNSGWTTVLHATNVNVAAWPVPGWVEFEFTTPFDYDGVSNLLIDYCVDNSYASSYGVCYYTTATNRMIYYSAELPSGDLLYQATGTRSYYRNNVQLVMQADTIVANITIDGAATPGYRNVSVTTPGGTDTQVNGFAVLGIPTVSSVSPSQAVQGQSLSVTITGTNLFGVTTVSFGSGITVNSFTVDSGTQITANISIGGSATTGARDVSVTNAAGTGTLTSGFTINQAPPTISSATPNQGVQTQTLDVTISGSYFTGASAVSFGADITVNSFTVNSATQIAANITIGGSAAAGLRDVSVTTPGGTATLTNGFTVLTMPTISTVNPSQADQGQSLSVTLTGTNLSGVTAVGFGSGITVNSFTVDSDTQITASITVSDSATVGTRDVSVTKAGVSAAMTSGFTVNQAPPEIGFVDPNQGIQGQTLDVTITGTHFTGATSVDFGPGITTNSFVVTPFAGASEVQIGSGTATTTFPFHTWYDDTRTQSILLASEIGQAGQIQKLRVYCSTRPGQNLSYFYIRMQHTTMNSFPSTSFVNSGWTIVLSATGVNVGAWTVPGWVEFELDTPFEYNGVDNLLIDYCVDNSYYTSNGYCYYTTATNRTLYDYHDLSGSNLLNSATGTLASWYNNVVLVMEGDTIEANITISGAATAGYRNVSVTTAEGNDTEANGFAVLGIPAISSVSPSQAAQGQAISVTITGTNFFGVTTVSFGSGITVNSFTVDSDSQITASITVSGSATVGSRDVSLTNAAGTGTLTGGFTVNQTPPTVSSVNPNQEVQGQTLNVIIWGNYFTGTTSVSFGSGITVNSFSVDSATQITANITISGSATPGLRDVSVTTPGGTATLTNGFTVLATPTVGSISPNQAAQGQALSVTITGTDLSGVTAVGFGSGVTVNSFTVDSDTQITASITIDGAAAAGYRDVSVTKAGATATLTNGFLGVAMPAISSVIPSQAIQGQALSVTITGTNLLGVTSVGFGSGITVNSFTVDNATQITASIAVSGSATVGTRDVSVTNAAGTATLTSGFTVNQAPPAITSVSPNQGIQGQTDNVTISGSYFTGATSVSFGAGITVNSFSVDSDTQITVNITIDGAATAGYRDVLVTTPEGTDTEVDGFLIVVTPTMSTVSPSQAVQGEALSVTITGTDFLGVTTVDFGSGITVNSFTVDNATQITASIAVSGSAAVGTRDVSVTNAAGTATLTSGFTVNQAPPAIASVNPNQGILGHTENVTILGSYFTGATSVSFGSGITVNSFTVDNATQITASITIDMAATAGHRDVSVATPGGTDTVTDGFLVVAMPTITSVSPSQAAQGQTLTIVITGANFFGATGVSFGYGITVNGFTVNSGTQITASIAVSGSAAVGTRDVSVTNAAGTAALTNGFTVNQAPPAIGSVNPNQGLQGQTFDVTVSGSYFTGASAVDFGADITVNSFTVDSSTRIRANITISGSAAPGQRNVSVTTTAGTATLTNGFTVVAMPTITSVSPSQASQGQTLTITIAGANLLGATAVGFGPGITVNEFTVNSSTEIVANITVGANATIGPRNVSVTTPSAVGNLADGFVVVVPSPSPSVDSLTPASGRQGAKLEVIITGANFTGVTDITLGEGVTVDSFTVDSSTQITAQLSIDAKATPGTRDVSVTTPDGSVTMSDVFEIQAKGVSTIPLYLWLLVVGGIAAGGFLLLAFLIKRRKKKLAETGAVSSSAS
jgi:hypothetical protein